MSKDLLVLADEYAAATATFARALALKDEADSMSPIAREAGDKRAVLAEALAALDTVRPVQVNAMLMEALERMVESVTGVDQVSAVDEARAALTAAQQAQPEPYGYHSPKTGKVYASTEAASMAMAGEVKTVYLATQAQPSQARVVELVAAANKDAVLQASIDFIRELTGMEPPPIEVAPPETFQPFKTFADKVCAIFATPQAAAQPPAPSDTAITYMTGYSDGREWAKPSQAGELSADDVRAAGGIVHSDGNIFFTNIGKLNAAIKQGGQ